MKIGPPVPVAKLGPRLAPQSVPKGAVLYRSPQRNVMRDYSGQPSDVGVYTEAGMGKERHRIHLAYLKACDDKRYAARYASPNWWRGEKQRDMVWRLVSPARKARICALLQEWGVGFGAYFK